ncbi:LytR/AlgR family response regulator transcription factor [Sphingobacterium sp. NGMCC 1.201703]|uniref:LytR/AlgR family response regulator transcription factor n=1 Tax=unclassified Sphingobacterium TaxID=2609468 RepID=UPI0025770645|nr:LytTR family DNA-binding domain-containing protein [Sphingobacterium sp. N143]MDM1296513.1 response regulator transcription factor [Sphingobacterium sp. N143]
MPKYSIVVVDDDRTDANRVVEQILKLKDIHKIGDFEDIKVFEDGKEALNYLMRNKVDILFLDIQMPALSGFELYKILPQHMRPALVFVTAYVEFALDSYKLDACDYLMKNVSFEAVFLALNKCLKRLGMPIIIAPEVQRQYYVYEVKDSRSKRVLHYQDIIYIQSIDNYVEIVTRNERLICRITMEEIEENMPLSYYARIHRGYIVNFKFVKDIDGAKLWLTEGEKVSLPISRSRRKNIAGMRKPAE